MLDGIGNSHVQRSPPVFAEEKSLSLLVP